MPTTNGDQFQIRELAARADVNPKTVRYYEALGLLPEPARLANGYRIYSETDLARLVFIRRAQRLGLSLDAIRDILTIHEAGERPCRHVQDLAEHRMAEIDHQIAELCQLRASLADLAIRAATVDDCDASGTNPICPAVEVTTS